MREAEPKSSRRVLLLASERGFRTLAYAFEASASVTAASRQAARSEVPSAAV